MTLIFLSLGWLVGTYLGMASWAEIGSSGEPLGLSAPAGGIALACLSALAGLSALLAGEDRRLRVTALAVAVGLLGLLRTLSILPASDPLSDQIGRELVVYGAVATRPEVRDSYQLLVLEVDRLGQGDSREQVQGRVLVRTDRYREWSYGDRVMATGRLAPVDAGSRYYAEYLERQGVHSTLEYPSLRLAEGRSTPDLLRAVDGLRDRLEQTCAILLPEPQASLLAGILVGARAGMPDDFRSALNATSTSHLVAVSGFNVTVVAGIAQVVALRFLARRKATLLAVAAVWLYSLLTGLPPSAFRAALMATMALSATLAGRGGDTLSFLLFSAALMVGLDPLILYDLGFQLSFLATAGLVLLEPVLRGWLARLPGWLASSLSVTLAAQLFTLPVLVGSFHTLSLVSPLSNLLVTPMLPGLMVSGGLAAGLGSLFHPLGQLLAPISWLYLSYMVEIIQWTARLPSAALSVGSFGYGMAAACYLLLIAISLWPMPEMRRTRDAVLALAGRAPRWVLVGVVAVLLSLGALGFSGRPDGKLHLYFLDVGHGDAALIRGPQGHWILVDGGPSPTAITEALGRRQSFLDRGLDVVVLTGYSDDRLAGLLEVVRRHPVGLVLQPGSPPREGAGRAWTQLLRERGIPVVQAATGQRIPLGESGWMQVIWAPGEKDAGEDVALALEVVSGRVSVLLPGDLPRTTQAGIARSLPHGVDLLQVPRHGAAGALEESFLRSIAPRAAVLSVGTNNRFGHPAEATLEMLKNAALLRTDLQGTVEMSIGSEGWELYTDR